MTQREEKRGEETGNCILAAAAVCNSAMRKRAMSTRKTDGSTLNSGTRQSCWFHAQQNETEGERPTQLHILRKEHFQIATANGA